MKTSMLPVFGAILLQGLAMAQSDIPLLRPEERKAVDAQTEEFNQSLVPALTEAAKSTVRVWSGRRRLAYGTVIGEGNKILTKWSEVAMATGNLRVESSAGEVLPARISGVYEDDDLAILETTGTPLAPVKWSADPPVLGAFLAAPQPDGRPAGNGVVSVLERNLRETDMAYLGVVGAPEFDGPGVKIRDVAADSGAAAAGIEAGDVILKIDDRTISGLLELKNSLVGVNPGTTVKVTARTGNGEKTFDVLLGNRPKLPNYLGGRLAQMEHMGTATSRVRDSFTHAIQSDMRLDPNQVGGPVVDLKGNVVGVTLARADRTRSFVMPAAAVRELLKTPAQDPSLVQVRQPDEEAALPVRRMAMPPGHPRPGSQQRMRRHIEEMQRLMEYMQDEMDDLEGR